VGAPRKVVSSPRLQKPRPMSLESIAGHIRFRSLAVCLYVRKSSSRKHYVQLTSHAAGYSQLSDPAMFSAQVRYSSLAAFGVSGWKPARSKPSIQKIDCSGQPSRRIIRSVCVCNLTGTPSSSRAGETDSSPQYLGLMRIDLTSRAVWPGPFKSFGTGFRLEGQSFVDH
jgi:hypothetical protein